VHTKRLKILASALERRAKSTNKPLNMDVWLMQPWRRQLSVCGSAGCALGVATRIPEFEAAGLLAETSQYNDCLYITYRDRTGFGAARAFFGLPPDYANYIFGPGAYRSPSNRVAPRTVANRIRKMVRAYEEEHL